MANSTEGDNYSYTVNNFKTHLIPTSQKTADWGYKVFISNKHLLSSAFVSINSANTANSFNLDYDLIRQYAQGNQPDSIYRVQFDPQQKQAIYTGLNWAIAPVIPTLRTRVLKELSQVPLDVVCEAVDEMANSKKNMDRLRLMAQPILDKKLARLSQKMGLERPIKSGFDKEILNKPQGGTIPDLGLDLSDDDEVDIYMDREAGYYNTNVEIANELGIKAIFEYNNFDEITKYLDEDLFDYGVCAYRRYTSTVTGMPTFQYLRTDKIFIQRSRYKDFRDANMWYYPVNASLADILDYFGDELTEADVKEIWEKANKRMPPELSGNASSFGFDWRRWNYGDLTRIEVDLSYFEFKSQNILSYEVSKTKNGSNKLKPKEYDYQPTGEKRKENYYAEVWYKGYFVQGMTKIFDWGLISDMVREKGKEQICRSTLNIYKVADKGWTEMMIPWANMYQLNFLKLQQEIVMSKPKGYFWNWDAISQPFIGSGGTITAEQVVQMFQQTGSAPYHSLDEAGEPILANANAPHMPAENGISKEARQFAEYMAMAQNQMAECIGTSPTADAVNPPNRLGLGIQQNAMQNSNNAKYTLIAGKQSLIVRAATDISYCLQEICKNNKRTWTKIKGMVGAMNAAIIESMDDLPMHEFGISAKDVPSQEQKNLVNQLVLQAYNKIPSELDLADVMNIVLMTNNWKLAVRLFELKQKKKAAMNAKMGQAQMAAQMQQAQQQDQIKILLQKMISESAMNVANINGKFGLMEQQAKDNSDLQKKFMSELNKLGINREQMQHEKELQSSEPQKVA
jgi:hypothetical protein